MALFTSTFIARLMSLFSSASIALCFAAGSAGVGSASTLTCGPPTLTNPGWRRSAWNLRGRVTPIDSYCYKGANADDSN